MQNDRIADELRQLSEKEFKDTMHVLSQLDDTNIAMITIEACRSLDYWFVTDSFSENRQRTLSEQDFNLVYRGWNIFLQKVLPRLGMLPGIPLLGSTRETILSTSAELHRLGRHALLKRTAELIDRKFAQGSWIDGKISVRMKRDDESDHFLDQVDAVRWNTISKKLLPWDSLAQQHLKTLRLAEWQDELKRLMFRWETPQGVMVGYNASPQLDDHFIGAVFDYVSACRANSGADPEAIINGIRVSDVHLIMMLLMSARLKHTQFVTAAKRRWPDVNYWMSLTIWKPRNEIVKEICETIAGKTDIDPESVFKVVDLLTIGPETKPDLSSDVDPLIPFFIKVSNQYLLEPSSVLIMNPFDMITRINPDQRIHQAISERREGLMLMNLNGLFQGNRYVRLEMPVRLKTAGKIVTDIDGAVLDRTTGELALFQLKWQDFKGATLRQTMSRAKNFVTSVSSWAEITSSWIENHGIDQLLRTLRIPKTASSHVISVHLFAIGQMSARFRHYGYNIENTALAVTTWPQFLRLRHEIGPAERVISCIFDKARTEAVRDVPVLAVPYEMHTCGRIIRFENMWNGFGELDSQAEALHQIG